MDWTWLKDHWQMFYMLLLVGLVLYGLVRNFAPDALILGAAVLSGLAGIIEPHEIFRGFANEAVLTVGVLFVIAAALRETGALDILGSRMLGKAKTETSALLRLGGSVMGSSAFLNNTPIVAMFLPITLDWCRQHRISPSRLLMPISFFAILGGICTLIGTSTNLVVDGLMGEWSRLNPEHGDDLRPMTLFELGKAGLPMALLGVAYLLVLGQRLLPDRKDLIEQLGENMREYLVDMVVQPGSRLVGQRIDQAGLRHLPGLFLVEILRDGRVIAPVEPDEVLQANDRLTFTGAVSTIVDLERIPGLVPAPDGGYVSTETKRRDRRLCEAVVSNTSPVVGKTIRDSDFRARYNAAIMAVHRGGTRLTGRIGDIVLRPGDTLLLQAGPHFVRAHRNDPDFFLVSRVDEARPVRHNRAGISILLLALLVLGFSAATFREHVPAAYQFLFPPEVVIAFVIGGLMVITRCISVSDARQSVDWQTLITIAASFGLGKAIENSGLANLIASGMYQGLGALNLGPELGPVAALSAIYLLTLVLSELLSNNAAAALMFPFGIATAAMFDVNARPFAMAIAFGASAAFATPIGYQTHMMVWGPGGYKFTDFTRVGIPLDLLLWIAGSVLIPIMWPLR